MPNDSEHIYLVKEYLVDLIENDNRCYGRLLPKPSVDIVINDNIGKVTLTFDAVNKLDGINVVIIISNFLGKSHRSIAFSILDLLQDILNVDINICYLNMKKGGV